MDLDALDLFAKITEAGSLTAAARLHLVPKSTLSLKLRQLESDLGVSLFAREGRGLVLTDAGAELCLHARRILDACDGARSALAHMRETVAGTLKVGSTGEFGTAFNAQMLYAFRQRYPLVKLDLVFIPPALLFAPDRLHGFDAIISWDQEAGDSREGEALGCDHFALFAAQSYLDRAGTPTTIEALYQHRGILYRRPDGLQSWRLTADGSAVDILPPHDFASNDYWTIKYFAVAGDGIAYLPTFFTSIECERGHLVPLLPQWQSDRQSIHIRTAPHAQQSPKLQAFVAFCKDYFSPGYGFRGPRYYVEALLDAPTGPAPTPHKEEL